MRVVERSRPEHSGCRRLKPSLDAILKTIDKQIKAIEAGMEAPIGQSKIMTRKIALVTAVKSAGAAPTAAMRKLITIINAKTETENLRTTR